MMMRKLHIDQKSNLEKEKKNVKKKEVRKTKDIPKIKGRKLDVSRATRFLKKQRPLEGKRYFKEKILTKKNLTYFVLVVVDLILIIYAARKNVVNYVQINGNNFFIGDEKNLWLGRNYISLIITMFFYIYTCVLHHYFLHEKNTKKFLVGLFFFFIILNGLLFYLFTVRVY